MGTLKEDIRARGVSEERSSRFSDISEMHFQTVTSCNRSPQIRIIFLILTFVAPPRFIPLFYSFVHSALHKPSCDHKPNIWNPPGFEETLAESLTLTPGDVKAKETGIQVNATVMYTTVWKWMQNVDFGSQKLSADYQTQRTQNKSGHNSWNILS